MENNKPVREDENKVVMSKLPRDEFSNFKKICDDENKTINKKIRELINQEVNKNFGFAVEANGTKKRFFIPAESKFLDVIEVEVSKNGILVKIKEDEDRGHDHLEIKKTEWGFVVGKRSKNV